eukprot:gene29715-38847_t
MDSVAGTYTQDVPDKIFLNEEPSTHGAISDDTNGNKKKRRKNKNYEALSRVENARSGPWTLEEQIYAMKIMDEFEAGRLPEIPPKWTLRVLLAHKLKCHKMRISKKFGGRCKGKIPYRNYYKNNPTNEITDMAMLRRFELEFLASIEDNATKNKDDGLQIPSTSSDSGLPTQSTALKLYNEAKRRNAIIPADSQQVSTQPNTHGDVRSSDSYDIARNASIIDISSSKSAHLSDNNNTPIVSSRSEIEVVDPLPRIRKLFNPFIDSFYNDCVPAIHVSEVKHV